MHLAHLTKSVVKMSPVPRTETKQICREDRKAERHSDGSRELQTGGTLAESLCSLCLCDLCVYGSDSSVQSPDWFSSKASLHLLSTPAWWSQLRWTSPRLDQIHSDLLGFP